MRCCGTCRAIYRSGFHRCPTDGTELSPFDADPVIGTIISGLYEVEACVGEGAMGRVYRAHHLRLQRRRVALKILLGDFTINVAMRMRFTQEAQAASMLSHPNVVPVLDFGRDEHGLLYLAMEYVEGRSLARIIAEEAPLAPDRVIHLARQLCLGLAHAHQRGLIHRDFKPDNVLVVDGPSGEVPRIADFGLAIFSDGEEHGARLTSAGTVVGTPLYTAPEQALDRVVDQRADLFGLGVSMYEMLAGVPPFDEGTSAIAVLHANLSAPRQPIAERAPGVVVDPALERIVHSLLSADREQRYPSANAVIEALDQLVEGVPGGAPLGMARTITIDLNDEDTDVSRARYVLPRRTGRRIAIAAVLVGGIAAAALAMFWPTARSRWSAGPAVAAGTAAVGTTPVGTTPVAAGSGKAVDEGGDHASVVAAGTPGAVASDGAARATRVDDESRVAAADAVAGVDDARGAGPAPRRSSRERLPRARTGRQVAGASMIMDPSGARLAAPGEASGDRAGGDQARPGDGERRGDGSGAVGAGVGDSAAGGAAAAISLSSTAPSSTTSPSPPPASVTGGPGELARGEQAPPSRSNPDPTHVDPARPGGAARRPTLTARAGIAGLTVDGSLSSAEVRRGIERVEPRLATCYRAAAIRAGHDAAGGVPISFIIGENGRATQVHAGGAPLPGLAACVSDAIGAVRTRVAPDVGDVRVSLRVSFDPVDR
ncbi:MAG TPA: protein kinase [Kofleriaceae bacterium]|nr:protein kinase [Kofleriaceae bacterium]